MTEKGYTENIDKSTEKDLTQVGGVLAQPLKKKAKARVFKLPNIKALQQNVKKYIIGQDKAVDRIVLAIYRSLKIQTIKTNILVIGKSGSGKTETMKQIANALKLPYTIEDATKFTKEGYVGKDVEEMVYNLFDNAMGDLKKAERGMLIIDEIDKKINSDQQSDISGKDVLNSLLKIVEGTKVTFGGEEFGMQDLLPEYIDTSKMVVVFMGAFSGIEEERKKRLRKGPKHIGFGEETESAETTVVQDERYTKEDLIAYGMPIEFAGRIDTIVEFEQLTKESLAQIAKNSKLSIFRKYEKYLAQSGIVLEYEDSIFEDIAKKAITKNTGAREISNVVNELFEPILYKVFTCEKGEYTKCILDKTFVQSPETGYKLI